MLVDSHCHLDTTASKREIESLLQRAEEAGVGLIQTVCTKISEFNKIYQIAKTYENVFCSVGNHPLDLDTEGIIKDQQIIEISKRSKVSAIGETGLDYFYCKSEWRKQQESFIQHIRAAQYTSLPIIIHTRNAEKDTIEILKKYQKLKSFSGVIHSFAGSDCFAQECLDMGLYLSASGIVTFKNARNIQKIFKGVPIERILIETDSPYLTPMPLRGKKNEPSYLKHTASFLATLKNITIDHLIDITTQNFFSLFRKTKVEKNKNANNFSGVR